MQEIGHTNDGEATARNLSHFQAFFFFFVKREREAGDKVTKQSPKPGKPYPIGIRTIIEI